MKSKYISIVGAASIIISSIAFFSSKSEAFNKFSSAEDESRLNAEQSENLKAIRTTNEQILEQLKINNELLLKLTNTPSAPRPMLDQMKKQGLAN